jgi:hypothetical protein
MAVARLAELLKGIFSSHTETRVQSELQLIAARNSSPEQLVTGLVVLVRQDPDIPVKKLAAVLLRQIFTPFSNLCAWDSLSPQVKSSVREELIAALDDETPSGVKANVCEAITELMLIAVKESDCQAVLDQLFEWVRSGKGQLAICAFTALDRICLVHAEEVAARKLDVAKAMTWCLQTDNLELKQVCIKVFCSCISALESNEVVFFRGLLQPILRSVVGLLETNEEQASLALNKLAELAESEPQFFQSQLRLLLELVTYVFQKEHLDFETKLTTMEFVVTLMEKLDFEEDRGSLGRGLNTMLLRLMTSISFTPDEVWAVDEDDASDAQLLSCTKTLARIVDNTEELTSVTDFIRSALNDGQWRSLQAGLLTLASITQFVYDKSALTAVMSLMPTYTAAEAHPRVKYAAVRFIWQLCDEAEEVYVKAYYAQIIPVLMNTSQDAVFRVVSVSVKAILRFVEVAPAELVACYLLEFLQKLVNLMGSTNGSLVEDVIEAINAIAVVNSAHCVAAHQVIIQKLFAVLTYFKAPSNPHSGHLSLKHKALDCLMMVLFALDKVTSKEYALLTVDLLRSMKDESASMRDELLNAWQRLSMLMKLDFTPYLGELVPSLLLLLQEEATEDSSM